MGCGLGLRLVVLTDHLHFAQLRVGFLQPRIRLVQFAPQADVGLEQAFHGVEQSRQLGWGKGHGCES